MDPSALGRYLRESREAKELTLEDAVTALRIRRPILEAFEQGDFSLVETPVQVRGLLRNYARFLDLEE
jgi:cytoskeleton protein RodZ